MATTFITVVIKFRFLPVTWSTNRFSPPVGWSYACRYTSRIVSTMCVSLPWASYQMRKIAGCACVGIAGNVFPATDFERKPLVSDHGMHHGTCVTHVPWCMSWLLTRGGGENIPGACATHNFTYLVRGPWPKQRAVLLNQLPIKQVYELISLNFSLSFLPF